MKFGDRIGDWTILGFLPDAEHRGVIHYLGYQPGNKRPIYATFEVVITGAHAHGTTPERIEVFSDSDRTAQERLQEASASLLLRSNQFGQAQSYMQTFFAGVHRAQM